MVGRLVDPAKAQRAVYYGYSLGYRARSSVRHHHVEAPEYRREHSIVGDNEFEKYNNLPPSKQGVFARRRLQVQGLSRVVHTAPLGRADHK